MIRSSGIPAPLRRLRPVLENGDGEIIWACGSPLADRFAATSSDRGPFMGIRLVP